MIDGVRCITKSGQAKSTSSASSFDVLNAKNCLGGCANFEVCVGAGNESLCDTLTKESCDKEGKYFTAAVDGQLATCRTYEAECALLKGVYRPPTKNNINGWCLTFPVEYVALDKDNLTEADKVNAEKAKALLCDSGIRNWWDCVIAPIAPAKVPAVGDASKTGGSVENVEKKKCEDKDIDDNKSIMIAAIIILSISVVAVCLCLVCCLYNPKCRQ